MDVNHTWFWESLKCIQPCPLFQIQHLVRVLCFLLVSMYLIFLLQDDGFASHSGVS